MWWNRPKTCEKCEELASKIKEIRLEFEELQDKVYHWMKRTGARVARAQAVQDGAAGDVEGAVTDPDMAVARDGAPPVRPENRARVAALLARRSR
jgi:hypothetical protein